MKAAFCRKVCTSSLLPLGVAAVAYDVCCDCGMTTAPPPPSRLLLIGYVYLFLMELGYSWGSTPKVPRLWKGFDFFHNNKNDDGAAQGKKG